MTTSSNHLSVQDAQNLARQFSSQIQENQRLRDIVHTQQESTSGLYETNFRAASDRTNLERQLRETQGALEAARFDADATKTLMKRKEENAAPVAKTSRFSSIKRIGLGLFFIAPYAYLGVQALLTQTTLLG